MVTKLFQNISTTSHIVTSRNCVNRSISFAAASLAFMLASNTFAAITQPQRITKTTLTGTNGTFSNAHYGYENLLSVQASTIGDVVVPSSGAAALIGLAGLVSSRRRRN